MFQRMMRLHQRMLSFQVDVAEKYEKAIGYKVKGRGFTLPFLMRKKDRRNETFLRTGSYYY